MIARRQTGHGSGLGRHSWVVERTFAWHWGPSLVPYHLVGELECYKDIHRLCYVRRPEGIIVEPAEQIG